MTLVRLTVIGHSWGGTFIYQAPTCWLISCALAHLENALVMYGVYNAEMLERLVKTVHALHSRQTMYESLFVDRTSAAYEYYSQMHGEQSIQHYAN